MSEEVTRAFHCFVARIKDPQFFAITGSLSCTICECVSWGLVPSRMAILAWHDAAAFQLLMFRSSAENVLGARPEK